MKYLPLVLANLRRHKLRTVLTMCSVALALFLFASLRTVVTTLNAGSQVSSASRMITQNSTAFVIPLPMSYAQRLKSVPHVQDVTWANWFGGKYGDGKKFFAQFAIDPESYLRIYPEIQVPEDQKQAFLKERSAALVGEKLLRDFGWKIGDNVTLQGTIFPGDWTFTIRGIYKPTLKEYGEDSFMFHYDYLYEREPTRVTPGWYIMKIDDPNAAPTVAKTIDDQFRNSTAPTKTGTEKAFAAGFASMWGNVKLLMSTIGMAVVFAILLVTANAMMMNQRERTVRGRGDEDRRLLRPARVRARDRRGGGHRDHRRGPRARCGDGAADRHRLRRRRLPAGLPRHAGARSCSAPWSRCCSPWRAASSRRGRPRSCPWCRRCGGSNEDPAHLQHPERLAAAGVDDADGARHRARRGGVRRHARAGERLHRGAGEDRLGRQRAAPAPRRRQRAVERHPARGDQHHRVVAAHRDGDGRSAAHEPRDVHRHQHPAARRRPSSRSPTSWRAACRTRRSRCGATSRSSRAAASPRGRARSASAPSSGAVQQRERRRRAAVLQPRLEGGLPVHRGRLELRVGDLGRERAVPERLPRRTRSRTSPSGSRTPAGSRMPSAPSSPTSASRSTRTASRSSTRASRSCSATSSASSPS